MGFEYLNLFALLFSCAFFMLISKKLGLSCKSSWIGFLALFVNFASLKVPWFEPVNTDFVALTLSLAMLYYFQSSRSLALAVTTVLGAYTWPILIYMGMLLLLFPNQPIQPVKTRLPQWLALMFCAFVLAELVHRYVLHSEVRDSYSVPFRLLLPVSAALTLAYCYLGTSILARGIGWRECLGSIRLKSALWAFAVWLLVALPVHLWANHSHYTVTLRSTFENLVRCSSAKPALWLVSDPLYLGPIFLLLVFCWRPLSELVRSQGIGFTACIGLGLVTGLTPEARQSTSSYAMAIPFLALLLQRFEMPGWLLGVIAFLSLAASKFWVTMNLPPVDDLHYTSFPLQRYFMNQGPWMSDQMYYLQGSAVAVVADFLYLSMRRANTSVNEASSEAD
jgi:hypothetical protein